MTTYGWDDGNRLVTMREPAGRERLWTYDAAERMATLTVGGHTYGFAYDALGRRIGVTMPSGVTHQLAYADQGDLAAYTAPGAQALTRSYGADGALGTMQRQSGRQVQHLYDAGRRPAGATSADATVTIGYSPGDSTLRPKTLTRTGGDSLTFGYDGDLTTSVQSDAGTVAVDFSDAAGDVRTKPR